MKMPLGKHLKDIPTYLYTTTGLVSLLLNRYSSYSLIRFHTVGPKQYIQFIAAKAPHCYSSGSGLYCQTSFRLFSSCQTCEVHGANLVSINSQEEQDFLERQMDLIAEQSPLITSWWTGAEQTENRWEWRWADGGLFLLKLSIILQPAIVFLYSSVLSQLY